MSVVGLCNVGRTSSRDLLTSGLTLSVGKMEKVPGVRRLKYAQPTERLTLACGSMVLAPI